MRRRWMIWAAVTAAAVALAVGLSFFVLGREGTMVAPAQQEAQQQEQDGRMSVREWAQWCAGVPALGIGAAGTYADLTENARERYLAFNEIYLRTPYNWDLQMVHSAWMGVSEAVYRFAIRQNPLELVDPLRVLVAATSGTGNAGQHLDNLPQAHLDILAEEGCHPRRD